MKFRLVKSQITPPAENSWIAASVRVPFIDEGKKGNTIFTREREKNRGMNAPREAVTAA